MANLCPWCGKKLDERTVEKGDIVRKVCSNCGFKLSEYKRQPAEIKKPESETIEIREEEKPVIREKPMWPWIVGAAAIIVLAIVLVQIFL